MEMLFYLFLSKTFVFSLSYGFRIFTELYIGMLRWIKVSTCNPTKNLDLLVIQFTFGFISFDGIVCLLNSIIISQLNWNIFALL